MGTQPRCTPTTFPLSFSLRIALCFDVYAPVFGCPKMSIYLSLFSLPYQPSLVLFFPLPFPSFCNDDDDNDSDDDDDDDDDEPRRISPITWVAQCALVRMASRGAIVSLYSSINQSIIRRIGQTEIMTLTIH